MPVNYNIKSQIIMLGISLGILGVMCAIFPGVNVAVLGSYYLLSLLGSLTAVRAAKINGKWLNIIIFTGLTLAFAGAIININYYLAETGDASRPVLYNYDSWCTWLVATGQRNEIVEVYTVLSRAVFNSVGADINLSLLFCTACYGPAIAVTAAITKKLTASDRTAALAALITLSNCYLLAQATILLKDVPTTLGFAICTWGMLKLAEKPLSAQSWALTLVGAVLIFVFRRLGMLMILAVPAMIWLSRPRIKTLIAYCLFALLCLGALWYTVSQTSTLNAAQIAGASIKGEAWLTMPPMETPTTAWWQGINGASTSLWRKLLWTPIACGVQFFVPFPWGWCKDIIYGPAHAIARVGFPWYLAGGMIIYYLIWCWRRSPSLLRAITIAGIILYAATAFYDMGRASRHALPILPLLIPAAAFALNTSFRIKSFRIWMAAFAGVCILVLFIAYRLHNHLFAA